MHQNKIKVLGIDFYNGPVCRVVDFLKNGGLLVVPPAPGLINIKKDKIYYYSLLKADVVIPDSGYMVLLWNITHREKINRISGLEFLQCFFNDPEVKNTKSILLVNPRPSEAKANTAYLNSIGFHISEDCSYQAPLYGSKKVEDPVLLQLINQKRPHYILINIGGGIQEKLGIWLKENLDYKPAIICTGAAIAFLTGMQANIPSWADKLYLGWLLRCIQNPKLFVPRYLRSFKLIFILLRYGKKGPSFSI